MTSNDEPEITGMERGTETKEELEALMSPEDLAMADQMAEDIIKKKAKANASFQGRRNRRAVNKMNAPEKLKIMQKGAEKILNLIAGKGFVHDPEEDIGGGTKN